MDLRSKIGYAVFMLGPLPRRLGQLPLTNGQRSYWATQLRGMKNDPTIIKLALGPEPEVDYPGPYEVEFNLPNKIDCEAWLAPFRKKMAERVNEEIQASIMQSLYALY